MADIQEFIQNASQVILSQGGGWVGGNCTKVILCVRVRIRDRVRVQFIECSTQSVNYTDSHNAPNTDINFFTYSGVPERVRHAKLEL